MNHPNIGFIQASWHKDIVDEFKHAFVAAVTDKAVGITPEPTIEYWEVPGSLEIPLQLQLCAASSDYDIFVVTGLVVDGGIYRHEFVADTVIKAVMQFQLERSIPVIYGVLTPHHFHGEEHETYFRNHFKVKGEEAAHACKKTLENLQEVAARKSAT